MADVLQTLAAAPTPAADPMGSEARKAQYRIAELLSQQGMDTSPIISPWQGLARVAQAGFGGWDRSLLDKEERAQTAAFRKLLNQDPRLATGEGAAPAAPSADRVATALAGLTPPAPREGDAALPRMPMPPAPREGALPPPTSGPRPSTAPPLIQQPVRQATEGVMPPEGLPGSGYGDDSYRMPLDQMRPPQASVRQAFAGPGATGPTPSPAPPDSMAPLPGSDAPIVPKQVQAVPVQPPGAVPQAPAAPSAPGAQPAQMNRVPTQMTPQIANYIRQLRATNNPAAVAQAEALTQQYSKPTEYDFKVFGDKIARTDKLGNMTVVGDANKKPNAIEEAEYAANNWQKLGFPDPQSTDPKAQQFWRQLNANRLSGVSTMIDQRAPDAFETHYGEGMAKQALATIDAGNTASLQGQKIQLAQRMLQDIQTGKITPTTSTVGAWMQAFGVDPARFGINPSTPMTAEALTGLTNDMVIGKIGAGGMPSNNFSDADRKFLEKTSTSLSDRPEANFLKLELARRVNELQAQKANAWADARDGGLSYEKFERQWRKDTQQKDIFGDLIEQAKAFGAQPGQQGGPIDQPKFREGVQSVVGSDQYKAAVEAAKKRGWTIPGVTQ